MKKILSFDGGGLKGIFSAILLNRIETTIKRQLINEVDIVAGTSSGSIIASGLASGYSSSEIIDLFKDNANKIFGEPKKTWSFRPKYDGENRKNVFETYFGDKKLNDIKNQIVITTVDLIHGSNKWQPVCLHNLRNSKSLDTSVVDALMASTCVPMFFPMHPANGTLYCDGGIWANNPSLAAYVSAISHVHCNYDHNDVVILSIGATTSLKKLEQGDIMLGLVNWFQKGFIDLLLDTSRDGTDYYLRNILGIKYARIDAIAEHIGFDDASAIDKIVDIANNVDIKPTIKWIDEYWK